MFSIEQEISGRENFHSLLSIVTFLLLPPFWFLSIPALVFSKEAKKLYNSGHVELSQIFSQKAKKFSVASWIIFVAMALSGICLYMFIVY